MVCPAACSRSGLFRQSEGWTKHLPPWHPHCSLSLCGSTQIAVATSNLAARGFMTQSLLGTDRCPALLTGRPQLVPVSRCDSSLHAGRQPVPLPFHGCQSFGKSHFGSRISYWLLSVNAPGCMCTSPSFEQRDLCDGMSSSCMPPEKHISIGMCCRSMGFVPLDSRLKAGRFLCIPIPTLPDTPVPEGGKISGLVETPGGMIGCLVLGLAPERPEDSE